MRARPAHGRNCACPRCRHVRRARAALYAAALATGCALSAAFPPETTIPGFGVPADLPR